MYRDIVFEGSELQQRFGVIVFVLEFKVQFGVLEELSEDFVNGR